MKKYLLEVENTFKKHKRKFSNTPDLYKTEIPKTGVLLSDILILS